MTTEEKLEWIPFDKDHIRAWYGLSTYYVRYSEISRSWMWGVYTHTDERTEKVADQATGLGRANKHYEESLLCPSP